MQSTASSQHVLLTGCRGDVILWSSCLFSAADIIARLTTSVYVCSLCSGMVGTILALASVAWATHASSRIIARACNMQDQFFLIAYPILLLYACFALITVF